MLVLFMCISLLSHCMFIIILEIDMKLIFLVGWFFPTIKAHFDYTFIIRVKILFVSVPFGTVPSSRLGMGLEETLALSGMLALHLLVKAQIFWLP